MAAKGSDRLTVGRAPAPAPRKAGQKAEPVPAGLALQQGAGNRAVVGLLQAQAKLSVGSVDDPLESEADRVADAVVAALRSPAAPVAGETADASATTDARRRVARMVQRLSVARAVGPEGGEVDSDVESNLQDARGGGRSMPEDVRRRMEAATGADFSAVRLHEGPQAASLSERLGAKAFTVGSDIFFRSGLPDTSTTDGQHLLAHELAHTVQQGGSARRSPVVQREEESSESESESDPEEGRTAEEDESEEAETEIEGALEEETSTGEERSTAPPEGIVADRPSPAAGGRVASTRAAAGGRSTGSRGMTVSLDLGLQDRETRTSQAEAQAIEDKVASSFTLTGSTKSGKNVTPFGAMGPRIEFKDLRYKAKAKKNGEGTATVKGTVLFDCHWGTNSGGRTDIASASSKEVTADTYQAIVDDLTPRAVEKSWVARRKTYYADHLTARHEKFHAADARSWAKDQGKAFLKNYLGKQTVVIADDERTDAAKLKAKMQPIADDAFNAYQSAFWTYMTGVGLTYYSYPCEEKAFGDGKEPYQKLADAVEKRGKELEKKAAAKAKKP